MTIRELIEQHKECVCAEVHTYTDPKYHKEVHSDWIEFIGDTWLEHLSEEILNREFNFLKDYWGVMEEDDYANTVDAKGMHISSFEEIFGDANAKVLVIVIDQEDDEEDDEEDNEE